MEHELKDIRYQSRKYEKLQTLMNRVNEESIKDAHRRQKKAKAVGVDGITKTEYDEKLDANVADLIRRMKQFSYKPQPVRRTYIPKANGKLRPLGIPAYEDRLVQSVMADILNDIYEERFLDCSFGFRPGRNAHQVVKYIDDVIMHKSVNYVLEADIKGFFDHVDHKWLMEFLRHDIQDENFLRYIVRFLKAGIMEGTEKQPSDEGTPQGGQISPILANVYLHYALDLWIEKVVRPQCKGEVYYIRYADDFLLFFQYEAEACAVLTALRARLGKFALELAEDKTRILPIGRRKGTKEDFDFLGYTFFNGKTRTGYYRLGVRTSKKKLKTKRKEMKQWLKANMHNPIAIVLESLKRKLVGHMNYYGVNGNLVQMSKFWRFTKGEYYKALNKRHQKHSISSQLFNELWQKYIPAPRITVNIWKLTPKVV